MSRLTVPVPEKPPAPPVDPMTLLALAPLKIIVPDVSTLKVLAKKFWADWASNDSVPPSRLTLLAPSAAVPFTCNVPTLNVVTPAYELAPLTIKVPGPITIKPPLPARLPPKVKLPFVLTLMAEDPVPKVAPRLTFALGPV